MYRAAPAFVYFVRRADGEGPIKIGCSQSPSGRLSSLMVWSPYPLEIVATIPGDENLERAFHAKFAAEHTHREWFAPSHELVETVRQVAAGSFDVSTLPAPKRLPLAPRPVRSALSRETQSLRARTTHMQNRSGYAMPGDLGKLVRSFHDLPEAARERVRSLVALYLADPVRHGQPLPYDWAVDRAAEWRRKAA